MVPGSQDATHLREKATVKEKEKEKAKEKEKEKARAKLEKEKARAKQEKEKEKEKVRLHFRSSSPTWSAPMSVRANRSPSPSCVLMASSVR